MAVSSLMVPLSTQAPDFTLPDTGKPVTGELLRAAIELTLAGQPVPEPHRPSLGCSIKWRS